MTLALAVPTRNYRIRLVQVEEQTPMAMRFRQLGFVEGMELRCEALAPLLRHPLLVRVRGTQVALALDEARRIHVEEIP